ncbi:hypothetical protein BJX62DRAFT_196615 [Aspergillus germanicus]
MFPSNRYSISSTSILGLAFFLLYLFSIRHYQASSYRDPTSFFFDASRAYERRYSSKRVQEASTFISNAGDIKPPRRIPGEQPILCVGIVSVPRRGDQYIGLTVGSLLDSLSEPDRRKMLLYLRIGNTNPVDHPIYAEKWVETLPDRLLTYSRDSADFEQLQEWERHGWYRNKTIYDFTTLISDCYNSGTKYIAIIEDDTLAAKGWFPSVLQALEMVEQRTVGQDWIYLRLFYIDRLLGWNGEEWPIYLAWSLIVWAALTGAMVVLKRIFKLRSVLTSLIWLASFVFIPAAISLHFMAGRQTMWPLPPGVHEMSKYGCCSQGLVFPRDIVPRFLEHTDLTTDWLVDMMVEKIADTQRWSRWVVVPPLLQHIGSVSSKGYGFDNSASEVWSFRFEEYPL